MPEDKSKKEEKPVKGVAGEKTGTEVLAEDKNNNIRDVINPREVIVTLGVLPIKGWPVKGVAGEKTGTEVLAEDKNNNIRDVINPREVIVTLGVLPIKGWADASTFEVGYYAGR